MINNYGKINLVSVGIIEDIEEVRESLRKYFKMQPDILCEAAVESVEDFLELDKDEIDLNVLLLDIDLPGISGISGMKFIKEKYPEIEIIILTIYEDHDKIFRALKAGASGYLLKTTAFPKIKEAVLETNAGGAPMSPVIARRVIAHFKKNVSSKEEHILTPKEKEIISYLIDGLTYNKIAQTLGNSVDTIRYHVKNIYRKLHVSSRAELINKELNR